MKNSNNKKSKKTIFDKKTTLIYNRVANLAYEKYMKTGIYFLTAIAPCLKRVKRKVGPDKGRMYTTLWYGGKRPTTSRCWGWHKKLKDAKKAVEENHCDMHECSYTWVVIEKVPQGVCSLEMKEVAWYHWEGNSRTGKWIETTKPEWSDGIVHWSIS